MSKKEVKISIELVNELLAYLKTCPYEEVYVLIARLMDEANEDIANSIGDSVNE